MVVKMVREKSNIKEMNNIRARMSELEQEYNKIEEELKVLEQQEQTLWVKQNACEICGVTGYTEWHHIISQHKCRQEGLDHLITARSNVIELCQRCHDLTTASILRKNMEGKTRVSKENVDAEPTERQINYIKKLGGEIPDNLTRQSASLLIDELKKQKENLTQTS
jgi:5-methylcytosine-specific restriction endonuclease McrA